MCDAPPKRPSVKLPSINIGVSLFGSWFFSHVADHLQRRVNYAILARRGQDVGFNPRPRGFAIPPLSRRVVEGSDFTSLPSPRAARRRWCPPCVLIRQRRIVDAVRHAFEDKTLEQIDDRRRVAGKLGAA